MYTNPSAAQSLRYVREALAATIAPELQSDKAKVVCAMMQTVLLSVERRIPVEQQLMADECNRIRGILARAAERCKGADNAAAAELRELAGSVPEGDDYAPMPSFDEISATYRELSALFTAALSPLHTLAAANVEGAQASLDEARAYTSLRLDRDMRAVFAMEGGLLGKG
jgi:hypothetical protein